jgi:hypothetical protein
MSNVVTARKISGTDEYKTPKAAGGTRCTCCRNAEIAQPFCDQYARACARIMGVAKATCCLGLSKIDKSRLAGARPSEPNCSYANRFRKYRR